MGEERIEIEPFDNETMDQNLLAGHGSVSATVPIILIQAYYLSILADYKLIKHPLCITIRGPIWAEVRRG